MWHRPIPLGLVKRNHTDDLNLYVPNATTITKDNVKQGATNVKSLAIWLVIVVVLLLTLTLSGGNQAGNGNAQARAYVVGTAGTNPNSNVVTGTFLLNNRYALILFVTGADRSFVSNTFSSLIDIVPTTLDHGYDVELADGSFDVISGMDWLTKYHAVIAEDKSEDKRLKNVPIIRDFPEVFPEDFPGIPPVRQVEFQIDLVPHVSPVARAPYRLASSEMKELSNQLQELSGKGFIRPISSPWRALTLFVKKKDGSF
ncbi:hypothetical protein Tco_0156679 [Tanacetum coccineum]